MLASLPRTTSIRALRLYDTDAENLPQVILDEFPDVPDSLEYLSWEGKEKKLFKIEREEEKVVALPCLYVRERIADDDNWSEKRILEYE